MTITAEQMPPEAVERMRHYFATIGMWTSDEEARAAIAAALNAWPGSYMVEEQHAKTIQWWPWRIKEWKYRFLHLPLPQENSE